MSNSLMRWPMAGGPARHGEVQFSQTCSLLSQFLKEKRTSGASTPELVLKWSLETNNASETPRPGKQAVGSDMRYPRRASLVKFLEKRKERVIARGPYQVNNPNPKPEGSSSGGEPYPVNCPNSKHEEGSSGVVPEDQSPNTLTLTHSGIAHGEFRLY
ncbi:uncharacterized protein DS421_18g629570 [Arachis hypogaea]|nr:uncharacterized protein DS421_18g629570 [Arachis hypogaea]